MCVTLGFYKAVRLMRQMLVVSHGFLGGRHMLLYKCNDSHPQQVVMSTLHVLCMLHALGKDRCFKSVCITHIHGAIQLVQKPRSILGSMLSNTQLYSWWKCRCHAEISGSLSGMYTFCRVSETPQSMLPSSLIVSMAAIPTQLFAATRGSLPSSPVMLCMTTSPPGRLGMASAMTTSPSPCSQYI